MRGGSCLAEATERHVRSETILRAVGRIVPPRVALRAPPERFARIGHQEDLFSFKRSRVERRTQKANARGSGGGCADNRRCGGGSGCSGGSGGGDSNGYVARVASRGAVAVAGAASEPLRLLELGQGHVNPAGVLNVQRDLANYLRNVFAGQRRQSTLLPEILHVAVGTRKTGVRLLDELHKFTGPNLGPAGWSFFSFSKMEGGPR